MAETPDLSEYGGGLEQPETPDVQPPTAETLIDKTQAVTFYQRGKNSRIVVDMAGEQWDVSMEFSIDEWTHDGVEALETQYATAFFPLEINVTPEHWEQLKEKWRNRAMIDDKSG